MGFIRTIFGRDGLTATAAGNLKTIGDVEKALSLLAEARRAAQSALTDASRKRAELLLLDESDEEIASLEKASDAHRLKLERADLVEPKLLARLQELRTDARNARWRDLLTRRDKAVSKFFGAAQAADEARRAVLAYFDEAAGAGFRAEASGFPVPPNLLDSSLILSFEANEERLRDARARPAQRAAIPATKAPAPSLTSTTTSAQKRPAPPWIKRTEAEHTRVEPTAPHKSRPTVVLAKSPVTNESGEIKVVLLRPGYEVGGKQIGVGEVIFLPKDLADGVLGAGVADLAA